MVKDKTYKINMTNKTDREVERIAKLAKISLTSEEIPLLRKQLAEILNYVEIIKKLEVKNALPTSAVTGLINVSREDKSKPSLDQTEVLSEAQEKDNHFFKTKSVFK